MDQQRQTEQRSSFVLYELLLPTNFTINCFIIGKQDKSGADGDANLCFYQKVINW